MKARLGRQEQLLLSYAQMRKLRAVRAGQLTADLKLTPTQEREIFRRLARGRMIVRIRPGLYLVPPQLPFGGSWSPSEALALNELMKDCDGRYQLCGPTAFNRYGFDEQVPIRTYVYNNRLSGDRAIGSLGLTLIKVNDDRLGSCETIRTREGDSIVFSSRVRTLVDAVYDWARFNSLPRAYTWIRNDLTARRIAPNDLVRDTLRYGDVGTIRRIGALLERERVSPSMLRKLARNLRPSTGTIPWIPSRPKRGKLDRRWGVIINDQA